MPDRTQEAVRRHAQDELFRSVFEHSAAGIALVGLDGHVREANRALQQMLGYTEAELRRMPFTEFTHPDDVAADSALFGELIEGFRTGYHLDKRFIHKGGRIVWVRLSVSLLRDADGQPTTVVGMAEDVTKQHLAQQERDGVLADLHERVKEATVLHAVARLLHESHESVESLLARTAALIPPGFHYPEGTGAALRFGDAVAVTPGFVEGAAATLRAAFTTRDGRRGEMVVSVVPPAGVAPEHVLLAEEQALIDSVAEMLLVVLERRTAEAALQRNEEHLRHALVAAAMGIWEWDVRTGRVTWSEELERIAGLEPGTFGGTFEAYRALVHPADKAAIQLALQQTLDDPSHGDVFESEFRLRLPDGNHRWCVSRGRVLRAADGQPVRMIGMTHDVTGLHALQRQLEQSQKMEALGRLAGGVAHDFNNLLTAVKGYAEFVIDALPSSDPSAADVREIASAADRASALTRQLLAFSRTKVLDRRVVRVSEIVRGMEKLIRRLIGQHIGVEVTVDDADALVRIDAGQLEQVILNLAVNARDAMPDGGRLHLRLGRARLDEAHQADGFDARTGEYAVLSVADTGVGMSPEVRTRIFDAFFTTKEVGRGTGLGLSTVQGIVQQGGGAIRVESQLGAGSTFTVHLPLVEATEEPRTGARSVGSPIRGTERVILVDDDVSVLTLAERALRAAGYTVHAFGDPREAAEFAASGGPAPDLLITDVVMPHLQGPELAAEVRRHLPRIAVLYITGFSDREIEPGTERVVLQKPFAPSALLRTMRDLLDT